MDMNQKLKNFLNKFIDMTEVSDDDNIFEKGLVNSLFAMQLVSFVEDEFQVTIDNDELDLENFKSISSIENLLNSKLKNAEVHK